MNFSFSKKSFLIIPFTILFAFILFDSGKVKAQDTVKSKVQVTEKKYNNVSTWKNNVPSNNDQQIDTSYNVIKRQKEKVTAKQVKDANPENYLKNSPDSAKIQDKIELTDKRDANSKTFKNPDGSYTKVQSLGNVHYKDNSNKWVPLDGKLKQNSGNAQLYEITQTDLPISIDISSGKTMMSLEKNKFVSFGDNVELLVLDTNFKEVSRIKDNKNNGNDAKEKSIKLKNVWNNIDREQQVDYGYAKTDYVFNSAPDYNISNGYLAFEDKVELPQGWNIVKATEGTENTIGWQGDLLITNESGQEVGRFHLPVCYDNSFTSSGNSKNSGTLKTTSTQKSNSEGITLGYYRFNKSGNKCIISVIVPLNWLLSKDRKYPVTIDPTASNTYSSGNIASCYYSSFNSVNMNVTVPNGSTVTATNSECTYVAVSPSWKSDAWIGFQSGSNLDGYYYCNSDYSGSCNITGATNSNIANGTYSNGTVPFTIKVSRDYPSGSCNTTYIYVSNSTWTETVTYTTPCTSPGAPTLTSPANNANVQPGKTIHFTWDAPTTGTTPFTYTFYFYNGSSWQNYSAGSNTYYDMQLKEYNSATWCGASLQWYVKATNSCGNTNSSTRNLIPYPKYSGSTADYTITPTSSCQTTASHSIGQGGANYYSFSATSGTTYYFSTCGANLGCSTSAGWDTYLKIYGTDGSCTTSAYNDDGTSCSNGESYINGWTCSTTGTYYVQITGYSSTDYGSYHLQYKYTIPCTSPGAPTLTSPANNANVQPGKTTHYTWDAPTSGTGPFTYTFYFNDGSWHNWSCDTNRYIDLQLSEYTTASWCGVNAQWYVKATNSCGNTNSSTRNLVPYPKYSGSTADYTITPTSSCQTTGSRTLDEGEAYYYSFNAVSGGKYYFSTCGTDLGCGSTTGWDTYLKIFGTNGSCTTSASVDDGSSCSHYESFINYWTCNTTGTYYLQVTGFDNNSHGTYYLQYKTTCPTLSANLSGGSTPICYNTAPAMFTATGSGGDGTYTYLWYKNSTSTGVTTQTYTAPALTANASIYCAVSSCGQTANTSTYNVTVNPLPNAEAGSDVAICSGGNTTLNASGGTSYSWSPATGLSSTTVSNPTANPTSTIVYTVTVTNANNCSATDNVTVTVNSLPNAEAGSNVAICNGGNTTLNASGGTSYSWSPATGLSSTTVSNPTANPTSTTVYTVTVSNASNCSATDNVTVTVNSNPTADAGSDVAICSGGSTTLNASGGTSYSWDPATGLSSTTVSNPTANPTSTTVYTVTVTNASNCSATDNVTVTVNSNPTAEAGSDVAICSGANTQLSASGGTSYSWSPATGLSATNIYNPTANPTSTTVYTVTVSNTNNCSATDNVTVTVNSNPTAEAGSDVAICNGGNTTLNASGGTSYSWSPATGLSLTTVSNPTANPTSTTVYTVTVTNANNCSASDNVTVTVNSNPTAEAGSNQNIYSGQSTTLNASGGVSYSWSPATGLSSTTISNPTASPTVTTIYSVTVADANGCSATDNVTVTVNERPYAILKKQLDGGFYTVYDGNVKFKFNEEYEQLPGAKITYKIFNSSHTKMVLDPNLNTENISFGENGIILNIHNCTIDLGPGYFIIEVTNDKNEKWFLRFKNETPGWDYNNNPC
jgi:hypothetical protein